MAKLISFDIDGTLEVGDPPGIITLDMVRKAKDLGYLIGSCSDRPLSHQRQLWETHNITVDFVVLKQHLAEVRSRFQAEAYYHIGDTDLDGFFAAGAGFHFIRADGTARDFPLLFPHPRPLPGGEGA
ncbi:MAG: HAD family hydrolase [Nitrospinae bacterium]|nr:HAD family hydrolase [Nitrospinota bacterium]